MDNCKEDECSSAVWSKGLCRKHYDKKRNEGKYNSRVPVCSIKNCPEPPTNPRAALKSRLCESHWNEAYLDLNHSYAPGYIDKAGYRVVGILGIKVLEHRLLMERKMKRRLTETETVHHKNGNRSDNRLSNLELWDNSHPYGQRVAEKLEWAKKFVATYDQPSNYFGLKGSTFSELNEDIPFVTGQILHTVSAEVYPGVRIYMPGKHQYDTYSPGGDAVITITDDSETLDDFKFKHDDFFVDIEKKTQFSRSETEILMRDLLNILRDGRLECNVSEGLPGIQPHLLLSAMQVLSVIEHRRYRQYENKYGGRFLFPRFLFGIVEGLWTAADAIERQRRGRPGVEWLEKEFGTPTLTKELME